MKKYAYGEPVSCLDELKTLKAVYVVPWRSTRPVAFFLSWQWRMIDDWVKRGHICRLIPLQKIEEAHHAIPS